MPLQPARHQELARELERTLRKAFEAAGWRVQVEPSTGQDYRPDLLVEQGPWRYVVELKVARESRREALPALLADAFLRASATAAPLGGQPLAMVGAPSISTALRQDLARYAGRFLKGAAWGVVDATGHVELHGPGLEGIHIQPEFERLEAGLPLRSRHTDQFSDLGQWMLKVLLAPRLPPGLLSAPREPVLNATQLARVAGVSVPSAARLVSHLKAGGFLEERRTLVLVNVGELLRRWRAASRPAREFPTRWLLPTAHSQKQLARVLARPIHPGPPAAPVGDGSRGALSSTGRRACLGLFTACDALGLGFVHGAPQHLYVDRVTPGVLESLGLSAARPGEAVDVWVRSPRFPESLFRGAVVTGRGPSTDVLQCWLDVLEHPARGQEQAALLYERVLGPALGEEPW